MTATDEQRARVAEYITDDLRYRGRTREAEAFEAVLADSEAASNGITDVPDPLTTIAWALRLPLLFEALGKSDSADENDRLLALITEGERVLGMQPPEDES